MRTAQGHAAIPTAHAISPDLLALRPRAIWRALRTQPVSAWFAYAYLFFEYVRPQSVYEWLDFFPWAQALLLGGFALSILHESKSRKMTLLDGAMFAFTLVVLASSAMATFPDKSFEYIDIYLSWVIAYWVISTTVNTQTRVMLLFIGWLLWNLKMSQHAFRSWASIGFGFRDWGVTGGPGWFHNSGEFGVEMTLMFPISLYFALGLRKHVSRSVFLGLLVLPVTAVSGAIASSSRGALVGVAAVGLWVLARSKYKLRVTLLIAVLAPLIYLVVPDEQKARFDAAGDDRTSVSRLIFWERGLEFAADHPLLGVGYKNWTDYYINEVGTNLREGERVSLPHNIFIEALAELGYVGLAALLGLIAGTFILNARTRTICRRLGESGRVLLHLAWGLDGALIGFMASGFFVTVLYYPYLWINLGMTTAVYLSVRRAAAAASRLSLTARPTGHNYGHTSSARPAWTMGR